MTTYRAAYIPSINGTSAGVRLTNEEDAGLPDAELMSKAEALAEEVGAEGEIIIGEWRE